MPGNTSRENPVRTTGLDGRQGNSWLTRKIWLPRLAYDALPWFYLVAGLTALLATLYVHQWFWVLPQYALFAVICFHLGFTIYRKRRRHRAGTPADSTDSGDAS